MPFLLLLLFATSLAAAPKTKEVVIDEKHRFPVNHFQKITPKVNVLTGEYIDEECDLVVHGSEPLSLRRFYGHFAPYQEGTTTWRFNPEHMCVANFAYNEQDLFASVGMANGNVIYLDGISSNSFSFAAKPSFMHMGQEPHPINTKVTFQQTPKDHKKGYSWFGQIKLGNGATRLFKSPQFFWTSNHTMYNFQRDPEWGTYKITPNVWTPYEVPIEEEHLPNGNILVYTYSTKFSLKYEYPDYNLLTSITAYNKTKTKILGSLTFNYKRNHKHLPICGLEVTGSDQRKVLFEYSSHGVDRLFLQNATTPDKPHTHYGVIKGSRDPLPVGYVHHPEGRVFITEYEKNNRVQRQLAPVGTNNEMVPIAHYIYHKNMTQIIDAEGDITNYVFDDNKKITSIETYSNKLLYSAEKFGWDGHGNLSWKRLEDGAGRLFLLEEYAYDKNFNIAKETIGDGKETYSVYRTYSDDGFNLLLSEWDDYGKKLTHTYYPGTNLLHTTAIYNGDTPCKRITRAYDDAAILISVIEEEGDLLKETTIRPKYSHPCFGLPEVVTEKIGGSLISKIAYTYTSFGKISKEEHYDSNDLLAYTILNTYDSREQLKSTTNALGETTFFTYDLNNNLILQQGPRSDLQKKWKFDLANRPIEESDGEVTSTTTYDKLGRVVKRIGINGFATSYTYNRLGKVSTITYPDGHTEKFEYTILGHCIREVDGEGYITEKKTNFRGQVMHLKHPDGGEESFTYRPDGKLLQSITKNGTVTSFSYDALGNLLKEVTNGTKVRTATFSPFRELSSTNPEGVTTHFTYDTKGRKTSEITDTKTTIFSYDSLNRLIHTATDDTFIALEYDLLNRPIKKTTESSQESYAYDPLGNRTQVTTSKGTWKTAYDKRSNPISQTDPLGFTTLTTYTYKNGLKKTTTSPNGVTTHISHDALDRISDIVILDRTGKPLQKCQRLYDRNGNKIEEKNGLSNDLILTYTYGPCKQLLSLEENKTKKTTYTYDSAGRLKTVTKPNDHALHHLYDTFGRLTRFTSPDFDYVYSYDLCDRILSVEDIHSHTITKRTYNPLGHLIQEDLANNLTLKTRFDALGRKKQLTLPDNSTIHFTHNGNKLHTVSRGTYTHTYTTRDPEGFCTLTTLPANLGTLTLSLDPLNRPTKITTPYYTAIYEKYDAVGNLCHYRTVDEVGAREHTCVYDDLNQLTSDNEHSFKYDALSNCTQIDERTFSLNPLCQITNEGYKYDANGALIETPTWRFRYDALDRLIESRRNDEVVTYTYDAFNRRMTKTTKETVQYLWDGENEIGCTDENGVLKQLRVLGEGLGAEIGAAVVMEFDARTYVPLYDHRGSLITLIDTETREVFPFRYTPFGEKEHGEATPWGFSSKRHDEETDLVYFGRRYYNPALGRWMTPDPQGFHDGPNLYAYVHNNPLTHIDLYGLKDNGIVNCWIRKYRGEPEPRRRCNHHDPHYEDNLPNKSSIYSLNRTELSGMKAGYLNGFGCTYDSAVDSSKYLSDTVGGINFTGIYNPYNGADEGLRSCWNNVVLHKVLPVADKLHEILKDHHEKCPREKFLLICHSEGVSIAKNLLVHSSREIRDSVIVIAIAPSVYIDRKYCCDVIHLRSDRDFVPLSFNRRGQQSCEDTTVVLKPHKDANFLDHGIQSPTYRDEIQKQFEFFYLKYRN